MIKILRSLAFVGALIILALPASAQTQQLKFGVVTPQGDNPEWHAVTAFKDYIEFRSGGSLEVRVFPGGQLGGGRAAVEAVQQGVADLYLAADGDLGGIFPQVQVFSVPYLFPSSQVAWRVFESSFAQKIMVEMRKATGLRTLALSENGFRSFTNSRRVVRTPEDLKGLRFRTMESPVYQRMVQSMGAAATPINAAELIMALKQGVVDGQENPPAVIHDFGIADVQKYMTLDEHVMSLHFVLMNDEIFEKLPDEHKRIVQEAGLLLAATENIFKSKSTRDYINRIKTKGVQVHISTAAEKESFRARAQEPVVQFLTERFGKPVMDELFATVETAKIQTYTRP